MVSKQGKRLTNRDVSQGDVHAVDEIPFHFHFDCRHPWTVGCMGDSSDFPRKGVILSMYVSIFPRFIQRRSP